MRINTKKIVAALMAVTFVLTGCSNKDSNRKSTKTKSSDIESSTAAFKEGNMQSYGAQISIADLKKAYEEEEITDIMPLYNVAPDEAFDFNFKVNLNEIYGDINLYEDVVTVHTDRQCLEESKLITITNITDTDDGGSKVTVSPCGAVLATDSDRKDDMNNNHYTWGNATVYYIAVHYSMEDDNLVPLDEPLIIPFTVKKEIQPPNVKGVVDSTGRFKLTWEPVEGATSYRIYSLVGDGQNTGTSNSPINGAQTAYNEVSLITENDTTQTEYDDFAGGDNHGIAVHPSSAGNGEYVIGQNFCVCGEYYVSAIVDGKESGLGAGVSTAELILPYLPSDESDIMFNHYNSVDELPLQLDIINIDGSVTSRNVLYTFQWGNSDDKTFPQYTFKVEGTALTGFVSIDGNLKEYPETVGDPASVGNQTPENNINKVPDPDVDTIITVDDTDPESTNDKKQTEKEETEPQETKQESEPQETQPQETKQESEPQETQPPETKQESEPQETEPQETKKQSGSKETKPEETKKSPEDTKKDENKSENNLAQQQQQNTQDHVENADVRTVVNKDDSYMVFADSAAEEWIARNMINGEESISLEAFPEMQDMSVLEDTLMKVYYQNPYILGVDSFSYDYSKISLEIKYVYDKDTISKKQGEISSAASSIVSSVIKDGMSDEDKRMALYDYLEKNTEYDNAALENAEANDFKNVDNEFKDSFNAYGILVNKVGVCQSYAYSYKLLCQMSGVKCAVVTGFLNGNLPHAWNSVNIDGKWFVTDVTNNGKSTGIPYYIYNADTDTSSLSGLTPDDLYDLDSNIQSYQTDDDEYEYYYSRGLWASDLDSYSEVLDKTLTPDSKDIFIRYSGESTDTEEIMKTIAVVYNKHGMEDNLSGLKFLAAGGYLVIVSAQN